jgi:hypothetical protein
MKLETFFEKFDQFALTRTGCNHEQDLAPDYQWPDPGTTEN